MTSSATLAAQSGLSVNANGGVYNNGKAHELTKKFEVENVIRLMKEEGETVSKRKLAIRAQVGETFALKVINELKEHGRLLDPKETFQVKRKRGPGAFTFDEEEDRVVKEVRRRNPQATLREYKEELQLETGTIVSTSTISACLLGRYLIPASFRKADLVPLDKFKPCNIRKAKDFIEFIIQEVDDPTRLKFGDEKLLKGVELYNRKVRKDPDTGEVPFVVTKGDFRNTYCITGFMGIDPETASFWYSLRKENTDSFTWRADLEECIASGFFRRGDILILDNAKWHCGGYNTDIEDFLWNYRMPCGRRLKVLVFWLPPRAAELNPIELDWHVLVRKLQTTFSWKLSQYCWYGSSSL